MPSYDEVEARDLLTRVSDKLSPDVARRHEAGLRLLDALTRLDGRVRGIQLKTASGERRPTVWVYANDRAAKVSLDGDGGITIQENDLPRKTVALVYDSTKDILESTKPETFRVPKPGEPVARRSALAEILEEALRTVGALSP